MSLTDLPDIDFVDPDVTATVTKLITTYEAVSGRTLYPADPVRLFLLAIAQMIVQQHVLINQIAKGSLLRYARKDMLDHLGAFAGTSRLPAYRAETTVRFRLSAAQSFAIPIPKGTRISTTGSPKTYFATTADAEVLPGALYADVLAECVEIGTAGNGFLPGQLQSLVDPIAYVSSATNITESTGGADPEADEAYRERIHAAPQAYSVAGPAGAYKHWAMTASSAIVDVHVHSPSPATVQIVPLLRDGEIPGPELLSKILEICNDKHIRPLTDLVTVTAPVTKPYAVHITYWIDQDRSVEAAAIHDAVHRAVDEYVTWQRQKLGRPINPSELIRRAMAAGALRVAVHEPVYGAIGEAEVASATSKTVTFGGFDRA